MEKNSCPISKYASIMYRWGQIYFDLKLTPYQLGAGQQFFLLRIFENPGINSIELSQSGCYDKGTTARAVLRLEELGYIRRITDRTDKRVHRIYTTETGEAVTQEIYKILDQWRDILTLNMTEEEIQAGNRIMKQMADNAYIYMKENRKKE